MPTFVVLHNFSGDNIGTMGDDMEDGKDALEAMRGELKGCISRSVNMTPSRIMDFSNDETSAPFVLTRAKENDIETETLRAFDEDETMDNITGLPG